MRHLTDALAVGAVATLLVSCTSQDTRTATTALDTTSPAPAVEVVNAPPATDLEAFDSQRGWHRLPDAARSQPAVAWRVPAPAGDDHGHDIANGTLITADRLTDDVVRVRRLDVLDGTTMWESEVVGRGAIRVRLDPTGDVAAVSTRPDDADKTTRLFDASTGDEIPVEPESGESVEAEFGLVTVDDVLLTMGIFDTTAFDRSTGRQLWSIDREVTVTGGRLFGDFEDGTLLLLDPRTGDVTWTFESNRVTTPQIVGETLVVIIDGAGSTETVRAIDLDGFSERWTTTIDRGLDTIVVPVGDDAIATVSNGAPVGDPGSVEVLELDDGARRWRSSGNGFDVLIADGESRIVIRTRTQQRVLDADGDVVSSGPPGPGSRIEQASGATYHFDGVTLWSVGFPGSEPDWMSPISVWTMRALVDDGFIIHGPGATTTAESELIAYRSAPPADGP